MISEVDQMTIPIILSNASQKAYEKFKKLILRIFSLLKRDKSEKDLKEEFYDSYIDFARQLDKEGLKEESTCYMAICSMYFNVMDNPEVLIAHESFFIDLFNAFDELFHVDEGIYKEKFEEFLRYKGKMQEYFYTEVAIPSKYYDKQVCCEIINCLVGDLDE